MLIIDLIVQFISVTYYSSKAWQLLYQTMRIVMTIASHACRETKIVSY